MSFKENLGLGIYGCEKAWERRKGFGYRHRFSLIFRQDLQDFD